MNMSIDRFDECFLKVVPKKIDTFSHQAMPCRYEPPIRPRSAEQRLRCPFKESGYCDTLLNKSVLDRVLKSAYSESIKNTLAQESTSVVIRSEQQFHGNDRQRFAQRRHFYEVVKNGTPGDESRFGVICSRLHDDDRLGTYLGFVDLRQHYNVSPLALGVLTEPGCLREDPNVHVIRGDYGPLFGAHSFMGTVYSMQDPGTIGAKCAQMCAIIVLGILADRGAEIKGSYTLTYIAWLLRKARLARIDPAEVREEINKFEKANSFDAFDPAGIDPITLSHLLRESGVGAEYFEVPYEAPVRRDLPSPSDRRVARVFEAYLRARFPIVLCVDAHMWRHGKKNDADAAPKAHAITLVGFRSSQMGDPTMWILHDPGWKPFAERTPQLLFRSTQEYAYRDPDTGTHHAKNRYCYVVATESEIVRHPNDCIDWLLSDPIERADFREYYLCAPSKNYKIFATSKNSIFRILLPTRANEYNARAFQSRLPANRFWCLVTYDGERFKTAWLFSTTSPTMARCVAKLVREDNDDIRMSQFDDQGRPLTVWL